jgi:hypothetical protein
MFPVYLSRPLKVCMDCGEVTSQTELCECKKKKLRDQLMKDLPDTNKKWKDCTNEDLAIVEKYLQKLKGQA